MRNIFKENRSNLLKGVIVWTPMLEKDDLAAANRAEKKYSNTRITHYWDPERILGGVLSQILKIKRGIAWDVYLAYPPDHPWIEELPPEPAFWMHQLNGEDQSLHLDSDIFTQKIKTMTGKIDEK